MWRTVLLTALTLASAAAAGFARARLDNPRSSTAAAANAPVRRIVSLAPALTEICCALGLENRLVGRSSFCDYPPSILHLPDVGGLLDPNVERIIALRPDLLLVQEAGQDQRQFLDAVQLPYFVLPNQSLADVFEAIQRLAGRCGVSPAADSLTKKLKDRAAAVQRRVAHVHPRRVLICLSTSRLPMRPPWIAGPDSFLGTLVAWAGHRVVPTDMGRPYAELSFEKILQTDPDVIIEFRGLVGESESAADDPFVTWASLGNLTAVRTRQIKIIRGAWHVVPGPRFVDTLDQLADLLAR